MAVAFSLPRWRWILSLPLYIFFTGDGSPRTLYDFANWQKFFGARFDGPEFTVADILYLAQPNAKLIITLREPVSRSVIV